MTINTQELVKALEEANIDIQAIDWQRLIQYLPDIVMEIQRIIDLINKIRGDGQSVEFASPEAERAYKAMQGSDAAQPAAIPWETIIPIVLPILLDWLKKRRG